MKEIEVRQKVQKLIDHYEAAKLGGREGKYSEADVKTKFIDPFFEALGWNPRSDEVKKEFAIGRKSVDYALQIGGVGAEPKIIIEAKKFDIPDGLDGKEWDSERQVAMPFPDKIVQYAWNSRVEWAILTNFKELRVYNVRWSKKPEKALWFAATCDKFLDKSILEKIWALSRESVATGQLDVVEVRGKRKPVDKQFLDDLIKCRLLLIDNIRKNNKLEPEPLKECAQRILDRLVIMRAAEDLGIETPDLLRREILKEKGGWYEFKQYLFRDFDRRFNSRIFAKHKCDALEIDDEVIEEVVRTLYEGTGESSGYLFDQIPADILGSMYEDYIGYILKEEGEIYKLEKEMKKRKARGIYYTPTYVVDYIVENTLGALLKGMKPSEVKNIHILDPACGSGSFLIKAQDVLKEYQKLTMKQLMKEEGRKIDVYMSKDYESLISKDIITQNIYGVDLDSQAAEIASVNLSLKVLAEMKKEMKLPEVMGENIKVGNSLISNHRQDLKKYFKHPLEKKPFNWDEEFPHIFEQGRFDVVIGNPPYGAKLDQSEKKYMEEEYECFGSKDTAEVFLERALKLTKKNGMMSMIIPKSLAFYTAWSKIRKLLLREATIVRLCDVGIAFKDVNYEQLILVIKKCKANENSEVIIDRATPLRRYLPKKEIATVGGVKQAMMKLENRLIFTSISTKIENVLKKISEKSVPLNSISKEIFRGLYIPDKTKEKLKPGKYKFLEKVPHVSRYSIKHLWEVDLSNKKWEKKIQKIIRPRVFMKVLRGKRLVAGYDFGEIVTTEKLVNVVLKKDSGYDIRFITAVINSPVPSFYMQKAFFSDTTETSRVMDGDYSGSIPIPKKSPMMQMEQKNIIGLVDKIVEFKKKSSKLNPVFERYVTEPVVAETSFGEYYHELSVKEKEALDNVSKGNIRKLRVEEEGDWLTFKVNYTVRKKGKKQEFKDIEIVKCKFKDEAIRKFLFYIINNYKKSLGTGNLLSKILDTSIPCFDKDVKKNKLIITKMMKEFLRVVKEKERLEKEIQRTDSLIDQKVYELYGLTEEEIKIIEKRS